MSPTARAAALLALLLLLAPHQAQSASAAGASHSLRGAHLGATGGSFGSLGQPGATAAAGATSSVRLGFWAVALPDLLLELELLGTAQGGSVSLTVAGIPLVVPTSGGQTAAEVAAAIAAAIEANTALVALGVRGLAVGSAVFTNGGLEMLVIADAGLGQPALIPLAPASLLVVFAALLLGVSFRRRLPLALALLVVGVLPGDAAAVPLEVSYQGQVLDSGGLPLTATVALELRIWNDATSTDPGDLLYEETHAAVSVSAGVFSVALGGGLVSVGTFGAALLVAPELWLEIEVDGDVQAPRERLRAVPYAIRAAEAENLGTLPSGFVEAYFSQVNLDGEAPGNLDPLEGAADVDGDGLSNFLDPDNDGDGWSDSFELGQGSDMNLDTRRTVFVTSQTWTGDLGGLAGADAKCQAAASAGGLAGTFLAWLADDTEFPASRFPTGLAPYVLVTGEIFAVALPIVFPLPSHALDTTEFGAVVSAEHVWTNAQSSGAPVIGGVHCQNWTSSSAAHQGRVGQTSLPAWSFVTTLTCDLQHHLYCFQLSAP